MIKIVLWVMLVFNGQPNPFVMGVWYQDEGEAICRNNTENDNADHHEPLRADCIKYLPQSE